MKKPVIAASDNGSGTLLSYSLGFILSVILTVIAYTSVVNRTMPDSILIAAVVGLAVAQLMVQLVFFLHLGKESKPRWNLTVFAFMFMVLVIVVFGSLWIMNNLNYHMMSDHDIMTDEGITSGEHSHD